MSQTPASVLHGILCQQLDDVHREWLEHQRVALLGEPGDRNLAIAIGMAPRKLPRTPLVLSNADLSAIAKVRPGWVLSGLSVSDAARVLFLSEVSAVAQDFVAMFRKLCQTADVAESIVLFKALPVLDGAAQLEDVVADGLRTNIKAVFEAIAHDNPYPREQFDEHRWNHMVLKALFIESTLAPIQGLDERANPELARIMRDFAHERWAAGRVVPFEIWRCVGPFAQDQDSIADLQRVILSTNNRERSAGALALARSQNDAARQLLVTVPDVAARIDSGDLTWSTLN